MRSLLASLLLTLLCGLASADPPHNASNAVACESDTTPSVGVTVGAGSDRYLIVWLYNDNAVTVNSVTFAAQTPTLHHTHSSRPGYRMFILAAPSTGAQTLDFALSGDPGRCFVGVSVYNGVASVGTAVDNEPFGNLSLNVSSATGDLVIDGAFTEGATIDVGAGQVSRAEVDNGGTMNRSWGQSEEAGAATVTMSWTGSGSGYHIGVNLVAAAAPSGGLLLRRRRN